LKVVLKQSFPPYTIRLFVPESYALADPHLGGGAPAALSRFQVGVPLMPLAFFNTHVSFTQGEV
jgi:hypothetical protein